MDNNNHSCILEPSFSSEVREQRMSSDNDTRSEIINARGN